MCMPVRASRFFLLSLVAHLNFLSFIVVALSQILERLLSGDECAPERENLLLPVVRTRDDELLEMIFISFRFVPVLGLTEMQTLILACVSTILPLMSCVLVLFAAR